MFLTFHPSGSAYIYQVYYFKAETMRISRSLYLGSRDINKSPSAAL